MMHPTLTGGGIMVRLFKKYPKNNPHSILESQCPGDGWQQCLGIFAVDAGWRLASCAWLVHRLCQGEP